MQQLQTNIILTIPEDLILVSKMDYIDLKEQQLLGTYWTMKDLELRTNKKHEWIKENILYPTRFRNILDVKNNGFVYYPEKRGQTWSFNAIEMAKFLNENFKSIFKEL